MDDSTNKNTAIVDYYGSRSAYSGRFPVRLNRAVSWLRPWLISGVVVLLAILLTVPWTYFVIQAAYDRDILQNATMLARRVEWQVAHTPSITLLQQPDEAFQALRAELIGDTSVQNVVFCDVSSLPRYALFTIQRDKRVPAPQWSEQQIRTMMAAGIQREEDADSYNITVPWQRNGRVQGFTYVELSRATLRREFWEKEGPLLGRVMGLTAAAIVFLSGAGVYAYRTWRKVGRVRLSAELAQQGLLAERGLTAAVLAHEIRNPLAALRFQLHSLRKNAEDPNRVETTTKTIDSELSRIQQLVTDYLEHERAVTLRVTSVDLESEARKLQSLMGELLRASETRFFIVPANEQVRVACDPHALRQVLMNLVLNAQQAMGRGGSITLRMGKSGNFGTIDLADTGPGIPDEIRDRLFKPFQTTRAQGTGIGLALVKRFVDNFGGTVSVSSRPGNGATFHLALPLAEQPTPPEQPPREPSEESALLPSAPSARS